MNPAEGSDAGGLAQGYTACGDFPDEEPKSCAPGQYCLDEIFSECSNGCLSELNCTDSQICAKEEGQDVGSCQASETPPPPTDSVARCQEACTALIQCGLVTANEGAQCSQECESISEAQRNAYADCVEPWSCETPIPGCIAAECGPSYPCSEGSCVDHVCL